MYFSQFWRLESPRSKCWQVRCLVRAQFLVHRWGLTVSSHGGEGGKGALWGLFYVSSPIHEAPPSCPNHLPKAPPPYPITLGGRNVHCGFWGRLKHSNQSTNLVASKSLILGSAIEMPRGWDGLGEVPGADVVTGTHILTISCWSRKLPGLLMEMSDAAEVI